MALRYGGRFSPDATEATSGVPGPDDPRPSRQERRTTLLYLVALPFAARAFFLDPAGLARTLGAFALLLAAAWLTREGVRAADAYARRRAARRPAFPRKMTATVLTAAGLYLGAAGGTMEAAPVLLGLIGAVLHFLAFGVDPLRDKGMDEIDIYEQDRVGRFVAEGETYLNAMTDAAARSGDRAVAARVARFAATARKLFRTVEEDPGDLTAARRYLGVYLMGARDATQKFADLWTRQRDDEARKRFMALLDDLETNFAARTTALRGDDRDDLDVEIDVLSDRLRREGVALARQAAQPEPVNSGE
ncbi:MAG: 5-bromo-4-chloroindolyl phosphate hydrolysis family protein [Defluviimonas sp.]|uniref:5-bromo-4-chloroindolyl phosphate hydrolysis family protein n=1 Tax=Albidovulum sp. TaxID=1872424 RepID=UPI001D3A69FF|nr:5-bromo-4-chloroindolyl phosphate hydrolysis family protein [Paracoccaceae bacterium]MCC0063802.1 5-bromo-4-chloroindolyl phosphate hydrolysis family protein [Defluviimonas sp.]